MEFRAREGDNGAGGVTIPKDTLRDWDLIDDDDEELANTHLLVEADDDELTVAPV